MSAPPVAVAPRGFHVPHRLVLVAIAVALIGLLFWSGVFQVERWAPFLKPNILWFLFQGLLGTLTIAAASLVASIVLGVPLGVGRSGLRGPARWLVGTWIELARATPILFVLIFFNLLQLRLDLNWSVIVVSIIGLTLYNSAVLAEILRAGIASIPRGEIEAARSLGLTYPQAMRHVILPQAVSRMMPAIVSQLITLIKDTSLCYVIGAQELVRYSRNVYVANANILETFFMVALVFFLLCFPLSRLSRRLEAGRPTGEQVELPLGDEVAPVR